MADTKPLNVPKAAPAHYRKNFIRLAVCELRFPSLLELEHRLPVEFQKGIRQDFPIYERATDLNVNVGGLAHAAVHRFTIRPGGAWTVSLRQSALSLETTHYESFDLFSKRLGAVASAAVPTIQSDFYTRVGLRYVNAIEVKQDDLDGWINPVLVKPLTDGVFGTVTNYIQEIVGSTEVGGFIFRHGVGVHPMSGRAEYMLDFDFFAENAETKQLADLVADLHDRAFSLFAWAVGPKAIDFIGGK